MNKVFSVKKVRGLKRCELWTWGHPQVPHSCSHGHFQSLNMTRTCRFSVLFTVSQFCSQWVKGKVWSQSISLLFEIVECCQQVQECQNLAQHRPPANEPPANDNWTGPRKRTVSLLSWVSVYYCAAIQSIRCTRYSHSYFYGQHPAIANNSVMA